jgi:hypothetical protein
MMKSLAVMIAFCFALPAPIATLRSVGDQQTDDSAYFDFWPGSWHRVDGDHIDPEASFVITRGINRSAFDEWWRLRGDKNEVLISRAMRVWDTSTRRWMLAWINADGVFQVWEGRTVGADWYVYRAFEQQGKRFWSRQAWIAGGPDRVTRIMERSFDDGASWELRSRTVFARQPTL